jgi:hypothetical protein
LWYSFDSIERRGFKSLIGKLLFKFFKYLYFFVFFFILIHSSALAGFFIVDVTPDINPDISADQVTVTIHDSDKPIETGNGNSVIIISLLTVYILTVLYFILRGGS